MTQKEYCLGVGIAVNSLQRWKKQEKVKKSAVRFVEVEPVEHRGREEKREIYRLEHQSGMSLQFGEGFDREEIRILIGIIQELGKCST